MTIRLNPQPPYPMTSDEFLVWASAHDVARVELIDGEVVATAGGTRGHSRIKSNAHVAIGKGLSGKRPACNSYIDDLSVVITDRTTYIPDVVVDCADEQDDDDLIAKEPMIVVEVLSQSTSRNDTDRKLIGYFTVPSIIHYLIVDGSSRNVVHHRREDEDIRTMIHDKGAITLDPPGISMNVGDLWLGLSTASAQ
jgi:Uma2 family endonuclease